ncbi:MAG TPA: AAA family ATPase [Prolixibacteraceae bacterium]|jgi:predicted ATPase
MNESIEIKNFGGIVYMSIELNQFNLFIGPQASGKSITAKLLYYFKNFPSMLIKSAEDEDIKKDFDSKLIKRFEEFFPVHSWPLKDFNIRYQFDDLFIEITKSSKTKIALNYSDFFNKELGRYRRNVIRLKEEDALKEEFEISKRPFRLREKFSSSLHNKYKTFGSSQFFIPAGRSFYANLQSSIFSFLSSNKAIDPFLIEFGSFYESIKGYDERRFNRKQEKSNIQVNRLFESIMCGKYLRENDKDYLIHNDKRKINLSYASSGQQETLPLALILRALENVRFGNGGATIFIEEPEAHLFPLAQKIMIDFISYIFNQSKSRLQFIITTHSPYILASLNNLMHAGTLLENLDESKKDELYNIVPQEMIIQPSLVKAYSLKNGKSESIICEESQIIEQSILDSVSDIIAIQFDKLLDLQE